MKHYAMFSVGDYELSDEYLAEFNVFDNVGQWLANTRKAINPNEYAHQLSLDLENTLDAERAAAAKAQQRAENAKTALGKAKNVADDIVSGTRKAYTRVREGKLEFIPQGLKQVGESTAGALKAGLDLASKNKVATGGIAAGGLAAIGGAYALSKRSKRKRR